MKISEIEGKRGNFSIRGVLEIIASERRNYDSKYCHQNTGYAIKSGKVSNDDLLVLLGSDKFKTVTHSVIVSKTGEVLVDSFKDGLISNNDKTFVYRDRHNIEQALDVVYSIPVGEFRDKYENHPES